jgi:O-antigen/teichoic acid export membrane protein
VKALECDPLSVRKRDVVRLAAVSSFAGLAGRAISVPTGVLVAYLLGPFQLGVLALIRLIQTYMSFSHMGLLAVLPRNVPIAYGRGDRPEASAVTSVVFTGVLISAVIAVVGLWVLYLGGVTFKNALTPPRMVLLTAVFLTSVALTLIRDYSKAEGHLMTLAKSDLLVSIVLPLSTVIGVVMLELEGALAAAVLVNIVTLVYCLTLLHWPRFTLYVDFRKTWSLLRTGLPVFANKLGDNIFWSVDLLMIGALMTVTDVGVYSLTLTAIATVHPFLAAFNNIVYRRIMEETGQKGIKDREHYRKYAGSASFVSYLMLNSLILGLAAIGLSAVVRVALPEYAESPNVMVVLTLGYTIYGSMVFMRYYLDATGQLHRRLGMVVGALLVNVLLDYAAISSGFGLRGVAWACTTAFVLNAGVILMFCFRQIHGDWRKGAVFVVQLLMIALLCFLFLAATMTMSLPDPPSLSPVERWLLAGVDAVVKAVMFVVWCTACYLIVFRRSNLSREILPAVQYFYVFVSGRIGFGRANA